VLAPARRARISSAWLDDVDNVWSVSMQLAIMAFLVVTYFSWPFGFSSHRTSRVRGSSSNSFGELSNNVRRNHQSLDTVTKTGGGSQEVEQLGSRGGSFLQRAVEMQRQKDMGLIKKQFAMELQKANQDAQRARAREMAD